MNLTYILLCFTCLGVRVTHSYLTTKFHQAALNQKQIQRTVLAMTGQEGCSTITTNDAFSKFSIFLSGVSAGPDISTVLELFLYLSIYLYFFLSSFSTPAHHDY